MFDLIDCIRKVFFGIYMEFFYRKIGNIRGFFVLIGDGIIGILYSMGKCLFMLDIVFKIGFDWSLI